MRLLCVTPPEQTKSIESTDENESEFCLLFNVVVVIARARATTLLPYELSESVNVHRIRSEFNVVKTRHVLLLRRPDGQSGPHVIIFINDNLLFQHGRFLMDFICLRLTKSTDERTADKK